MKIFITFYPLLLRKYHHQYTKSPFLDTNQSSSNRPTVSATNPAIHGIGHRIPLDLQYTHIFGVPGLPGRHQGNDGYRIPLSYSIPPAHRYRTWLATTMTISFSERARCGSVAPEAFGSSGSRSPYAHERRAAEIITRISTSQNYWIFYETANIYH